MKRSVLLLIPLALLSLSGCGRGKSAIGTAQNPIRMAIVPSVERQTLITSGDELSKMIQKQTGYFVKVSVPTSYAAVVEAMGSKQVDVGWLPPFPYVLARQKFGANVILKTVRGGSASYNGLIVVRSDSGIKKLADLKGKRFAYVDPLSTSGCVYPKILFIKNGYDPEKFFSKTYFAGSHDAVVVAVVRGQVDAGAIYGGPVSDAREQTIKAIPDVMEKTKIIAKTDPIPNDTVSVRKDLPADVVKKLTDGLIAVAKSEEGRKTILTLYGIDSLVPAKSSDYDSVEFAAEKLNIDLQATARKKK